MKEKNLYGRKALGPLLNFLGDNYPDVAKEKIANQISSEESLSNLNQYIYSDWGLERGKKYFEDIIDLVENKLPYKKVISFKKNLDSLFHEN